MLQRCPSRVYIGIGYLNHFTLYFGGTSIYWDGGAFAAIKEQPGEVVWGVIYDLTEEEFIELDNIENVPTDYLRLPIVVTDASGAEMSAFVYMASEIASGIPSSEYLHTIRLGAHVAGLPVDYIEKFFARPTPPLLDSPLTSVSDTGDFESTVSTRTLS